MEDIFGALHSSPYSRSCCENPSYFDFPFHNIFLYFFKNFSSVGVVMSVLRRSGVAARPPLVRCVTTGEHHSYRPGIIARFLRRLFLALVPRGAHKRWATNMRAGMERVEKLEQEQLWLRKHGSPLQVMGLPDHAELSDVRARYRDLVFETHPDTATGDAATRYDAIQTAYQMATSQNSLWHLNGSAPVLYNQLTAVAGRSARRLNRVTLFAVFSYAVMAAFGVIFATVVVKQSLEVALRFFDPEFYDFMVSQEQEEERQRSAGESVDTDPKRLAPTIVKKLLFPGRFIHGGDPPPSQD